MITIESRGDFKKANTFFQRILNVVKLGTLDKYGRRGVEALASATPKESGLTAKSWNYSIEREKGITKLVWYNTNVNDGVNIAIILQYGHGTGTGGYVQGIDYINPSIRPIFDEIAEDIWEEVKRA